jgi:hypothetical protein
MKPEQLEQMTIQEACDYAVKQIVKQGGQCLNNEDSCAFGNKTGQHCVFGWLMDESNQEMMEHTGEVDDFIDYFWECLPPVILNNVDTLRVLQGFHDSERSESRVYFRNYLSDYIDTSGVHWQQWIDMGD